MWNKKRPGARLCLSLREKYNFRYTCRVYFKMKSNGTNLSNRTRIYLYSIEDDSSKFLYRMLISKNRYLKYLADLGLLFRRTQNEDITPSSNSTVSLQKRNRIEERYRNSKYQWSINLILDRSFHSPDSTIAHNFLDWPNFHSRHARKRKSFTIVVLFASRAEAF